MSNNNNPFQNMGQGPQLPPGFAIGRRTSGSTKFLIVLLLGVLPFLLCSIFLMDPNMADQFKQWGKTGHTMTRSLDLNYGLMWLVGIGVFAATQFILTIIIGKFKEVGADVRPGTTAFSLMMMNFFLIPHVSAWFLILSIPAFLIIGYIIGVIIGAFIMFANIKKQVTKMQSDPNFAEILEKMQQGHGGMNPTFNPNANGKGNKKPNLDVEKPKPKDYADNPFVDVKDEDEDQEK